MDYGIYKLSNIQFPKHVTVSALLKEGYAYDDIASMCNMSVNRVKQLEAKAKYLT